jgi:hypothetical protein
VFTARYGLGLCIVRVNISLFGRAMTQAVSRRPHNAETRCQSQASNFDIYSRQSSTYPWFSLGFPLSFPFYQRSELAYIYIVLLPERQPCEVSESSKQQSSFENPRALDRKVLSSCISLWGLMRPWLYIRFGVATYLVRKSLHCRVYIFSFDSLRAGRSGNRIPVGARFSAPIQTGPGGHPASYTMGSGSFPGVKRPGRGVDHPTPI